MKVQLNCLMLGTLAIAGLFVPATAGAEFHSRSKEIVVMEARDLPELAQLPGDSLFLHSDSQGSTYLDIEQQQGTRLSVLDVTDPAHIRVASTIKLQTSGTFDFAGALNGDAELIRFRKDNHTAILDLHHANRPQIKAADGFGNLELTEYLGSEGILAGTAANLRRSDDTVDFNVLDVSVSSAPLILTTIKNVEQRTGNQETGTTFLIGKGGLTVIRQLSVEYEHWVHEMQMRGN